MMRRRVFRPVRFLRIWKAAGIRWQNETQHVKMKNRITVWRSVILRKKVTLMITYSELFQFGILIVSIITLCVTIMRRKWNDSLI